MHVTHRIFSTSATWPLSPRDPIESPWLPPQYEFLFKANILECMFVVTRDKCIPPMNILRTVADCETVIAIFYVVVLEE